MNGYLKINSALPANPNYKKLTDVTLLPSLAIAGLAAGYAPKTNENFNFADSTYSQIVGNQNLKKGELGAFLDKSSYIDTGIAKKDNYTYLVIAPRTATINGFLMGDYIAKSQSADNLEHGTTLSSRGDVFAGVPNGIASAFGTQASNISGEMTLFIFSCIKNSDTSYTLNYANIQGGRNILLTKNIPNAVNTTGNTVGVGWSKKADALPWDANQREIVYACLYDRGVDLTSMTTWVEQIRLELALHHNLII